MSEIKDRLKEAVENTLKQYDAWDSDKKSIDARESLQEAIHELRKVGSRLEIEIAISEREAMSSKPIPIPPHRSSSKAKGAVESILPDKGNTEGNGNANNGTNVGKSTGGARRPRTRRPSPKKQG